MSALARIGGFAIAVSIAIAPPRASADEAPAPIDRPTRRNAITTSAAFPIPEFGVAVAYQRALGRRYSLSGALEYAIPRLGYGHLVGMSESLGAQVWITRPLHGVFFDGTLTVAHTSLTAAPLLRRVAIAPGVGAGFRWQLAFGLILGASAGLRFSQAVAGSPLICTRAEMCPATRTGIHARLTLDVGWAF